MQRVAVVGPVASGKTTLAHALAQRAGLPHTELDVLRFALGWSQVPDGEFRGRVAELVRRERWVIDGNYASVRDLLWRRADTVVWLDYSLSVVLWRLLSRTVRRVVGREDLGSGRRERIGRLFDAKVDHLVGDHFAPAITR
jgi:adenylate kinase family enzyme